MIWMFLFILASVGIRSGILIFVVPALRLHWINIEQRLFFLDFLHFEVVREIFVCWGTFFYFEVFEVNPKRRMFGTSILSYSLSRLLHHLQELIGTYIICEIFFRLAVKILIFSFFFLFKKIIENFVFLIKNLLVSIILFLLVISFCLL